MAQRVGLIEAIEQEIHLLKVHLPYHESDHVLNIAYSLIAGGCLDDIELRRHLTLLAVVTRGGKDLLEMRQRRPHADRRYSLPCPFPMERGALDPGLEGPVRPERRTNLGAGAFETKQRPIPALRSTGSRPRGEPRGELESAPAIPWRISLTISPNLLEKDAWLFVFMADSFLF